MIYEQKQQHLLTRLSQLTVLKCTITNTNICSDFFSFTVLNFNPIISYVCSCLRPLNSQVKVDVLFLELVEPAFEAKSWFGFDN